MSKGPSVRVLYEPTDFCLDGAFLLFSSVLFFFFFNIIFLSLTPFNPWAALASRLASWPGLAIQTPVESLEMNQSVRDKPTEGKRGSHGPGCRPRCGYLKGLPSSWLMPEPRRGT